MGERPPLAQPVQLAAATLAVEQEKLKCLFWSTVVIFCLIVHFFFAFIMNSFLKKQNMHLMNLTNQHWQNLGI